MVCSIYPNRNASFNEHTENEKFNILFNASTTFLLALGGGGNGLFACSLTFRFSNDNGLQKIKTAISYISA